MKLKFFTAMAMALLFGADMVAENTVTITGKVKFSDPDFVMSVYRRDGTSKKVLAETKLNPDNTYSITVPFEEAGEATLDCGHWQSVNVWLEDENLDIDFRGLDTAKIKIKNPPYVYIKGGKNNELMNFINFEVYRNYQAMIAASQAAYHAPIADEKAKQEFSMKLYDASNDNYRAHARFLAEHYADRNSVLSIIERMNDEALVNQTLATLEQQGPKSKELVDKFRARRAAAKEAAERMNIGNPAPNFKFVTDKGKKTDLDAYKGKILVLDFWASWCGPCRGEVPNLKKYYEQFKGKDVEFLSVSIDADKEAWKKALKEEQMPWKQGWVEDAGKNVMQTYQFGGIPFILVIDKDGKLYRKHLRGEKIQKAVQDCLNGVPAEAPKKGKSFSMGAAMM